jgi:hypothetical protein
LELWQWGGLSDSLLRCTPKQDAYDRLVESYQVIENGKAIDLKLRKRVKFASVRIWFSEGFVVPRS